MIVRPDSEHMKIMGRTTQVGEILYLGFSASYIEFETMASRICVTMCTDVTPQEESLLGWFAVYLDDGAQPAVRRALTKPEENFVIFEEEQARKVTLRRVKRSEASVGLGGVTEFD
ncbi:MAG: hypothetical protein K2K87_12935, partial [Lachnospiraceae bacterium]|nr:hypothetical protein [Lachnospiraceae bacterium]